MIRAAELGFGYGNRPVLQNLTFDVRPGEILTILGPNGCGKSTLLRLMRGLLKPDQGRLEWDNRAAHQIRRDAMARLAAVVPQFTQTHFPYTVRQMTAMGRYAYRTAFSPPTAEDRKAVEQAMAVTDTLHLAERAITGLSGGELQRVVLARALAQQTPVLLLDEATSHLDLDHRLEIADLLSRLNREKGTTIIQVSHDLDLAAQISHRLMLLSDGGILTSLGPPQEVLTAESLRRVFRVEVRVETNPYTGTPRVFPVIRRRQGATIQSHLHVVCGGGSGADLLRRLHVAGCTLTVGPLNRGDSDAALALALELDTVLEEPFCPLSFRVIATAREKASAADAILLAPTFWGSGNLAGLEMVLTLRKEGKEVFVLDPRPDRDFTGGRAWALIEDIRACGGHVIEDIETIFDAVGEKKSGCTKN